MLFMCCWLCQHAEYNSYGAITTSTKILKGSLVGQAESHVSGLEPLCKVTYSEAVEVELQRKPPVVEVLMT